MNVFMYFSRRSPQDVKLLRHEARSILRLAAPLALTELSFMAIVATDVIMMGWLGSVSLAAGTLAGHYLWVFEFFAVGLLCAIAPILSQHLGARRFRMIRRTVRHGFWLAVIVALPCGAMIWYAAPVLVFLGQDAELAQMGQSYLRFMVIGLLPALWHLVLSEFLVAHDRPRAALVIGILGIGVNVLADYALMFGHFGFPAMGLVGAGVASAIVSTLMFLAMLLFVVNDSRLKRYRLFGYFWRLDWPRLREIITIGVPIALTEMGDIAAVLGGSLLMGLISVDALAAYGVTVQCIEILVIVPIGLMQAASVRVGRAAGAGDHQATLRAGAISIGFGFVYALLVAAIFVLFADWLVGVYLDGTIAENQLASELAISFLTVAALYFVADTVQTISRGALMGLTDTQVPMMLALGCYGLSLPAAAYLVINMGYGGQAVWLSLSVPLALLAVLFIQRFRSKCTDMERS